MSNARFFGVSAAVLVGLIAFPAAAQKSKSTLRMAVQTVIPTLSTFEFPTPDSTLFSRELYDNFQTYDEVQKKWGPGLAKSIKYLSDTEIEFTLRDDITFHNGNKLTADDAVYTLNWSVDPTNKIYLPNRYTGVIKKAEKTGPYTFIMHTQAPTAIDLLRLRSFYTYDHRVHAPLEDKSEYGRKGIGTGPLRLVSFDAGQKFAMEPFKDYKLDSPIKFSRIEVLMIKDTQTQVAQLLTGNIDVMRDPSPDTLAEFSKRPGMASTVAGGGNIVYIKLDAINRTGQAEALKDVRVRKAMAMAIDKKELIRNFGPDPNGLALDATCTSHMIACVYNVKSPGYDPEGAKALLKEAGYADGFDAVMDTRNIYTSWAQAISGQWRKVGIRVQVNPTIDTVYRKNIASGAQQAGMTSMPILALPDAHLTYQVIFPTDLADYTGDPLIAKLGTEGLSTRDAAARDKIYAEMYDRINSQVYVIPVTLVQDSYLHTADLAYQQSPTLAFTPRIGDFHWK